MFNDIVFKFEQIKGNPVSLYSPLLLAVLIIAPMRCNNLYKQFNCFGCNIVYYEVIVDYSIPIVSTAYWLFFPLNMLSIMLRYFQYKK